MHNSRSYADGARPAGSATCKKYLLVRVAPEGALKAQITTRSCYSSVANPLNWMPNAATWALKFGSAAERQAFCQTCASAMSASSQPVGSQQQQQQQSVAALGRDVLRSASGDGSSGTLPTYLPPGVAGAK